MLHGMPRIHQLTEQILAEGGALADATIIAAARSTKHNQRRAAKRIDWRLGLKAHIGTERCDTVHSLNPTAVNVPDSGCRSCCTISVRCLQPGVLEWRTGRLCWPALSSQASLVVQPAEVLP